MGEPTLSKEQKNNINQEYSYQNSALRQFLVYLISFAIVVGTVVGVINAAYNKYIKAVDPNDKSEIVVEVPMDTSASGIGSILLKKGLINNKGVFKIFIDLSDKASNIKAGKYKLSKNMSLPEIVEGLTSGDAYIPQKRFTIPEGRTISEIASALEKSGKFSFTADQFIKAASEVDKYTEKFPFLKGIPKERREGKYAQYPLEGYLFPETYFVDEDAKPEDIITTMLNQFAKVYKGEYESRAEELGLTTDQVVIFASIVQKEAKIKEEFPQISAVFHNRLRKEMPFESCATIQYVTGKKSLILSSEETKINSKYNTYKYKGFPIGPICCSGEMAIKAALFPQEEFMNPDKPYLYFVLKDPMKGSHAFNYDYKSHLEDKKKYEKLWKENE